MGVDAYLDRTVLKETIENVEAYIQAGLKWAVSLKNLNVA